jgi:hypothetical protein
MDSINALPVKHHLGLAYLVSGVLALVITVASLIGLLWTHIYPHELRLGLIGTDATNLIVGVPLLLGSMWFAHRGSLVGLLFWPGALFYVLYAYAFYLIGMPFNVLFLPYVTIVTLSTYTIIGILANIDGDAVRKRLAGGVPTRLVGGVLAGFAILLIAYEAFAVVTTLISGTPVSTPTHVTWIVDLALECPALLIGGILLWRHAALGYVVVAGLLLQIDALFVAVFLIPVCQALVTASPIDAGQVTVDLGLGLFCAAILAVLVQMAARRLGTAALRTNEASLERADTSTEPSAAGQAGNDLVTSGRYASSAAEDGRNKGDVHG